MTKVFVTVGVSASGKTTWADDVANFMWHNGDSVVVISRDDIRREIVREQIGEFSDSIWKHWKFNSTNEDEVSLRWRQKFDAALTDKTDYIIIADTNLNAKFRKQILVTCIENNAKFEIKEFPISLDDAISRDANRVDSVGESVIRKQYAQWENYLNEKSDSV